MTEPIDDLAAMRRRMWDRCMQHCRDRGMMEAEALEVTDEAMNSPPREPLPTLGGHASCPNSAYLIYGRRKRLL